MVSGMVREFGYLVYQWEVTSMKEDITLIKRMDMDNTNGIMEQYSKGTLKMISAMDMERCRISTGT